MSVWNSQSSRTYLSICQPDTLRHLRDHCLANPCRAREQLEYRIDGAWHNVRLLHHSVHESLLRRARSQQRIPCKHIQRILFGKRASVAVHSEWDRSGRIWQKNGWLLTKAESRMEAQNVSAELSGLAWTEDNHANHMCDIRSGCFALKSRTSGDSVDDGHCCLLQRPYPVHVRLVRLLLQRGLAPEKNSNFPLHQSRLRFCNKGCSSISPPQVRALFSNRRRKPPERDVTPVLDEAGAELALPVWPSVTSRFSSVAAVRLRIPPLGAILHRKAKEDSRRNSSTLEWSVAKLECGSCMCVRGNCQDITVGTTSARNDASVLRSRNHTFSQGLNESHRSLEHVLNVMCAMCQHLRVNRTFEQKRKNLCAQTSRSNMRTMWHLNMKTFALCEYFVQNEWREF